MHLSQYITAKEQLNCICPPDIWKNVNGEKLAEDWKIALQKRFLPKFIEKFKKHFSTNRLEKKDAAYKCFAMESILKIDKKSNLTEEEIHKLIRNNMEKLLDDKNSLYFQIVDFVKKEYFGV